jgi:thioredoxin reductase
MTKHYAVIGAGAGGLCAAKNLLARGLDVTIFEVGSCIGGLWVYENDSGLSPAYRSLHINSEARVSSFVDFQFPPGTSLYPDHREMRRYFENYAEHFGLKDKIRFKSRVTSVAPEGGSWRLVTESGEEFEFAGVVIATGHQSVPRHPPEIQGFQGEYLHAHSYRVPESFAGKRVLVIGPGNSGVDIAADLCALTERTVLSARSPVLIMPRMMFGVPNSRVLGALDKPFLPWWLRIKIRIWLTQVFHGRMEQWGFRTPSTRTHPISHPTLISHIAWKRIAVKPGLKGVIGKNVTFVDESSEEFDAIIGATGYVTNLPFLQPEHSPVNDDKFVLYNRVAHPDLKELYFVGFFDVSGGSNIRMMDDQAEYVAAIASGTVTLPSRDEMKRSIAEDVAWYEAMFPNAPRYANELDPRRYRRALAREYKRCGASRLVHQQPGYKLHEVVTP